MGSIVKSIGKAIKKVGKFVKKAAPYILMAAALYAGVGAFGASLPGATGSMFAWSNVKAGASAIGSNIAGMFGGSAAGVGEAAAQALARFSREANVRHVGRVCRDREGGEGARLG